jgi:hypothetical protein
MCRARGDIKTPDAPAVRKSPGNKQVILIGTVAAMEGSCGGVFIACKASGTDEAAAGGRPWGTRPLALA